MSDPQQQHPPPHPPNHQENQENLGTNGTTITPAAAIGDQYSHDFKRDRNCDFCYVCQNYWPTNTKVVSPFNSCSICGITVHTSCLSIAKCYHSCEANAVHHKYTTSELNSLNNAGKFFVKLKHVYDIVGQSGVVLYGIVRLSSNKHFLTTEQAIVRDQDCVWNEETKGRYLKYKVESSDQPALTGGFLEIEVWKSVFSVFDTLVGSSRISIIPLLIHQNKVIERWFELRTSEGEIFGTLLVKLNYIRDEGNSQLNKIENLNTEYQQTEDNKVVVTPEVAPLKPIEALDIAEKLTPERKQVPKPRQLEQLPPEKEQPIPPKTPYVSNSTASAKSLNGFKLDPSVMQDIQNAANAGGSKVKFSPLHDNKAPPSFAPISKRNIEVHKTVSDMQSQGNKTFTTEPSDVADNETSSTISEASLNIWERVSGALSGAKKSGLYVYNSLLNENIRTRLSKPNNSKIDISKSIGVLYVNLASAYVENAHDAAEGDYYVMVSLIAGTPEDDLDEFTHVVKESASPVFNKKN